MGKSRLISSGDNAAGLKRIRLEEVQSQTALIKDQCHHYVFQASLSEEGRLQKRGYAAVGYMCKVEKYEPLARYSEGHLILKEDAWAFSYNNEKEEHSFGVEKLESDVFVLGALVSIMSRNGSVRLYRVVSVEPAHIAILNKLPARTKWSHSESASLSKKI